MLGLLCVGTVPQAHAQPNPIKLSGNLPTNNTYMISPDGSRIVFQAQYGSSTQQVQLYSAPLDGSAPPVLLSHPFPSLDTTVGSFLIAPNSGYVVFEVLRDLPEYDDLQRSSCGAWRAGMWKVTSS